VAVVAFVAVVTAVSRLLRTDEMTDRWQMTDDMTEAQEFRTHDRSLAFRAHDVNKERILSLYERRYRA
jgi:ribosomal protein L16 Arg81 hydroxylase